MKDSGVIPWDFRLLWLEFLGPHARKGITRSELGNRMIHDMQLAGLVDGTRREYLRAVRQLTACYLVAPDQLIRGRDEICADRGGWPTLDLVPTLRVGMHSPTLRVV